MWEDDQFWLPQVIDGKKLVCTFDFDDKDIMLNKIVNIVPAHHELIA
jgi:hypothetical protein